jgi:RNA polymerase sigma-70 factor, ECF subfamily
MTDKHLEPPPVHGFPASLYDFFFKQRGDRLLALFFRRNGASTEDAEDMVQEVILKAVRSYETRKGDTPLKPWIWTIARSHLIDSLRGKSYRDTESIDPADATEILDRLFLDPSEEERALLKERQRRIQEAFEKFSKDHPEPAKVLFMFLNEDMTLSEMAGVLGRSPGATREYVSQVRKRFTPYLWEALDVK